ncbi:zinc finger protein 92-like [Ylistrum balloti]|uniref:zinc finger protein 92-like n=1 Tax=Ylistrum balloti TaxID=509963 RepID=UPI002905A307|nr:zinc finger protein 92-like [Ylistrum balloti]XP_060072463.1 zinc finger protein 92-like [Ylistrum balloti]
MTTVEVTTTATSNEPRLLSLRVTPEQEIAIYAFFQINGWTIITEEVPRNCETCQRSINGDGTDPPRCQMCQRVLDNNEEDAVEGTDVQTSLVQPTIIQYQQQGGRKVVVVGNTMTMAPQTTKPTNIIKQQGPNPVHVNVIPAKGEAKPLQINLVPQTDKVVDPQPKIYNINNSADNRPYRCDDCGKHFRKKSHVVAHMKFHSGEALPKCEVCGKEFLYKHNLISHASIHSGARPFQCTMCPKNFRRKDDLQVHTRTHTGERPYKCDVCGKCFTTQNQLPKHRRTHTGEKPYECSQCQKCFRTKPHLEKHMRTHSGERPYKCEECGRAFTQNAHLMAHLRIHSGEKPFECDICNKSFKEAKTLRKHKDIHIKGMPYTCKICDKGFLRAQNLEVHMCVHSEDEPKYKRKIREKRELMERLRKEQQEKEEEEVLQKSMTAEEIEQSSSGVVIVDENGQTIRVIENGDMATTEVSHGDKEAGQDNISNSIANSLLTLVEMITNADQGSNTPVTMASSEEKVAGLKAEQTVEISEVEETLQQVETMESDASNNLASSQEKTILIPASQSEQANIDNITHVVSSNSDNIVEITEEEQPTIIGNLQHVVPGLRIGGGDSSIGMIDTSQVALQEGMVITEVSQDGTTEQIVEHLPQQFSVDGETFVMEVQYVDDAETVQE